MFKFGGEFLPLPCSRSLAAAVVSFGEPISDWNRSLWIHVGKNGGMSGVQIGWRFLAECISAEADVHLSAILGLVISDWGKIDYGAFILFARMITVIWYGERNTWYNELGSSQLI